MNLTYLGDYISWVKISEKSCQLYLLIVFKGGKSFYMRLFGFSAHSLEDPSLDAAESNMLIDCHQYLSDR